MCKNPGKGRLLFYSKYQDFKEIAPAAVKHCKHIGSSQSVQNLIFTLCIE